MGPFYLDKLTQILRIICGCKLLEMKERAVYVNILYVCFLFAFNIASFDFSSPEPKAPVSFSDHNLSVVRRHCCCSCR